MKRLFGPGDHVIRCRYTCGAGDDDRLVPADWIGRLAEHIPDSTASIVPGQGHFLIHAEASSVLEIMAAA